MGGAKMKLNYYYEELFMESDKHSDEICVGSCIGCLFTPDEFYTVYNSDDHRTFRDRLVEITEERQCT